MTRQLSDLETNPALPSFWPSLAAASAELRRDRSSRLGRMRSENPAVLERTPPVSVREGTARRTSAGVAADRRKGGHR
jgi:hypothetical protein